jgi:hypothetical protein
MFLRQSNKKWVNNMCVMLLNNQGEGEQSFKN